MHRRIHIHGVASINQGNCDDTMKVMKINSRCDIGGHRVSTLIPTGIEKTEKDERDSSVHSSMMCKPRVTFQETVRCNRIPANCSLSREEREAVWMTRNEMEIIAEECCRIIMVMESNNEQYPSRGLESYTRQGSIAKHRNRSSALRIVLSLQSRGLSSEVMAQAYQTASSIPQLRAYTVGLRDQIEAESLI